MDVQLQRGDSNQYCFVSDCASRGRGKGAHARGALTFHLSFVRFVRFDPKDKHSDGDNVPEGVMEEMSVADLAAWWAANPEWRVVDV